MDIPTPWAPLVIGLELLLQIVVAMVVLVRARTVPAVRLSWLLTVLVLPVAGAVAYLLFGEVRLGSRRVRRHRAIHERLSALAGEDGAPVETTEPTKVALLATAVGGRPVRDGNRVRLFRSHGSTFEAMEQDIDSAGSSCHLLTYIYLDDSTGRRVGKALMRAARRGVRCRVLVDAHGSRAFLKSELRRQMTEAGVQVVAALPAGFVRRGFARLDHRNHRKITIIDGTVGWTGSQNIADAAFAIKARYAPWVDLMIRIEGPAVHDLQLLFTEDWVLDADEEISRVLTPLPPKMEGGVPVQIMGTGPSAHNRALRSLTLLSFLRAEEEIVVTTPYFVPDDTTVSALCTTARCGVRTVLVVPARNDSPFVAAASRSYYGALLEAGAEIYEYHPGLLHAKTYTVDRRSSVVASMNLDRRSFELNFEVSAIVYDSDFTSELRYLQHSYLAESSPIELAAWSQRGIHRRLWENTMGVLAPLL